MKTPEIPWSVKTAGTILSVPLAIAAINAACDDGSTASTGSPTPIRTEQQTTTPIPSWATTIEDPKPTRETPSPTLSSEPIPDFDCVVLDPQYCSDGKIVEWKNPSSETIFRLISLNIPAGIPIYAPFDGQFSVTQSEQNPYKPNASLISIYNDKAPNTPIFGITGSIRINTDLNPSHAEVIKGDIIGYTQATEEDIPDKNILISFTSLDPLKKIFTTDENLNSQYFPTITK